MASLHPCTVTPTAPDAQSAQVSIPRPGRLGGARRNARLQYGSLVDSALSAHGVSNATAGERVGLSATRMRAKRAGEDPIDLCELAQMGPAVELHVLEARIRWLREQARPSRLPPVTRALRAAAAFGGVAAEVNEAERDGEIDAAERRRILEANQKARAELDALDDDVRAARVNCAQGGR